MPSVFQAEVMAILEAAKWLLDKNTQDKNIDFFVDNQAAIYSLRKTIVIDMLALETKRTLNLLSENNLVRINWIPGHQGFKGNEIADRKAKIGTQTVTEWCEPAIPVMDEFFRKETLKSSKEIHNKKWYDTFPKYRQSRLFYHEIRPRETRWLLNQDRKQVHDLTGLITGHNSLNYHQFHLNNTDTPNCRFCDLYRETSAHLLTNCPALAGKIQEKIGNFRPRIPDLHYTSLKVISKIWDIIEQKLDNHQ